MLIKLLECSIEKIDLCIHVRLRSKVTCLKTFNRYSMCHASHEAIIINYIYIYIYIYIIVYIGNQENIDYFQLNRKQVLFRRL